MMNLNENSILLVTLNSRYHHTAFGLRCLFANLEELQPHTKIVEFVINQNARDIAEKLIAQNPKIIGFGVYIWNTNQTYQVVSLVKRLRPEIKLILGGPEVSYEYEGQPICQLADHTILNEADFLFRDSCRKLLNVNPEEASSPLEKIIRGPLPEISQLKYPYEYYSDSDIQNRTIYVEASRGCPYKCEYCLSSLDKSVRAFPLDSFLVELDKLMDRGVRQFKFLDRTFNLGVNTSLRILEFFLTRIDRGLFLHFEMVPDRLPDELRSLIKKFPAGALQFEIGIQTWNPAVARLVSRRQDYVKIQDNIRFLATETGVHMHVDLIAGLPSEDLNSFAEGFDAVANLNPHEIQLGLLKRLKGTPIARHEKTFTMIYEENSPFQIITTSTMDYATIQNIDRFSGFWDRFANSGQFVGFMAMLKELAQQRSQPSLFWIFDEFRLFLEERHATSHSNSLAKLTESAYFFLTDKLGVDQKRAGEILRLDYTKVNGRDLPEFLKTETVVASKSTPERQKRHIKTLVSD